MIFMRLKAPESTWKHSTPVFNPPWTVYKEARVINQGKIPWNRPSWPGIKLGPQGGQKVRYINSPTELSRSWKRQQVQVRGSMSHDSTRVDASTTIEEILYRLFLGDLVCYHHGQSVTSRQNADLEIFYDTGTCTPGTPNRRTYAAYIAPLGQICCSRWTKSTFFHQESGYKQSQCPWRWVNVNIFVIQIVSIVPFHLIAQKTAPL